MFYISSTNQHISIRAGNHSTVASSTLASASPFNTCFRVSLSALSTPSMSGSWELGNIFLVSRVCQCLGRQSNVNLSSHRRSRQMERRKKTNRMLITVTIIFFISWAPLNIFNIVIDIFEPFDNSEEDTRLMLMIFAFCHLSAMTSVCSNPVMYGFLNENFKQSFTSLVSNCKCFQRFLQQNRSVSTRLNF